MNLNKIKKIVNSFYQLIVFLKWIRGEGKEAELLFFF